MHAALGDPTRLAIVDELARTDRSPSELGSRLGLTTNLLAHHLDVLEAAALIERFVSSGDRRRRYIRLVHHHLDRLRPERTDAVPSRPLFLCTHNSARSQLAAVVWRSRTGGTADCAGTEPAAAPHPEAIAAAKRLGLTYSFSVPRIVTDDDLDHADLVVTVCDRAHEELDLDLGSIHWSLPDPAADGSPAAFDAIVVALDDRIRALAPDTDLTPTSVPPHSQEATT